MQLTCTNEKCQHEFEAEDFEDGKCPKCGLKYAYYIGGSWEDDSEYVDAIFENESDSVKNHFLEFPESRFKD